MTSRISFAFVLLACMVYVSNCQEPSSDFRQCTSNPQCGQNECCKIGPSRFSIPQCSPRLPEGASCRPGDAVTINGDVSYPDGSVLKLMGVHWILCPCAEGLTCDRTAGGVCKRV